jgi:GH25 family lysozyme M1 (1,4-beta-N-acetylmuramidase)
MTLSGLAADLPSSLILGSVPYFPAVVSDVVIDLSHWQAPVDFVRAKSAGIAAVILKATQGLYWIDGTFATRFAAATAAGLLVGAYHFLDNSAPGLQVENFLSVAEGCPLLALDAEANDIGSRDGRAGR